MSKRRYLLALSVPLLMLTVAFSTRTTAATPAGTGAPGFTVWPTYGGPSGGNSTSPDCPKTYSVCWVILGNPANADSALAWGAGAQVEDGSNVKFTPSSGILAPGQHVKVIISNWPCQDAGGTWYFSGTAVNPAVYGTAQAVVPVAGCG